jgi:CheY-like chemotaxis protein
MRSVLAVDSDPHYLDAIKRVLERDNDRLPDAQQLQVFRVPDSRDALDILTRFPVDVIITEIKLDLPNGLAWVNQLHKRYPKSKILVLTKEGAGENQAACKDAGAELFLKKSAVDMRSDALARIVRDLVRPSSDASKGSGLVGMPSPAVPKLKVREVILLLCDEKASAIVSAYSTRGEGEIFVVFINQGNVVHCESESGRGLKALQKLLSEQKIEFKLQDYRKPEETSIKAGDWEPLIRTGEPMMIKSLAEAGLAAPGTPGSGIINAGGSGNIALPSGASSEENPASMFDIAELVICTDEGMPLQVEHSNDPDVRMNITEMLIIKMKSIGAELELGPLVALEANGAKQQAVMIERDEVHGFILTKTKGISANSLRVLLETLMEPHLENR